MKCPKCQAENPENTRFCGHCGSPLSVSDQIHLGKTLTLETPQRELERGALFAQRYEVIEELGTGGMGKVYRVRDKKINEEVALKLIRPEIADSQTIQRFSNELKTARKISHKNICRMYHLSEETGTHYITMEYISGETLKNMIQMTKQLSTGTAVNIAKQVCEGLVEAHKLGVVHRDLKPQNIMIDREGNARIMDFGIARSLEIKGTTGAGGMIGTPEYMSPEQTERRDVDHSSDIYSLGLILYEMLTGKVPFEAETPFGVAMKHKSEKPLPPKKLNPQIPEDLNRLILKCLEKDPQNRYPTAQALLAELARIQEHFPTTERETPRGKPAAVRKKAALPTLKNLRVPALIFAGLVVAAVIIWQILPPKPTVPPPSDKPSLAILYFKNNTGEDNLDHWRTALTDLMITDLSQSKYIRILSGEILYNILRQLDQLDATTYSSDVLKKVAERGGIQNILIGNYTKAGDTFRINITLQDPHTGEFLGSESVEGVGERSFYAMVDELTRRIKENFALTEEEITQDFDSEIETITTSSPEAFKHYSEGRVYHMRAQYWESITSMQKALDIDPEFAMAWRSVAMSYNNMGNRPGRINAIQKAFEQRSKVSERERFIIEADYYKTWEKSYRKAMEAYLQLLDLYPEDVIGNTNLGILYFELEDWDKAIELYNRNIQNYPDTLISHWNLIETYMAMGLYDKAIETAERFLRFYPDNYGFHIKIVRNLLFQEKYDKALDKLEEASAVNPKDTAGINIYRGNTYLLRGDLADARQHFEQLPEGSMAQRQSLGALYLIQGKFEEAKAQYQKDPVMYKPLAYFLLRTNHPEEALEEIEVLLQKAVESENLSRQIQILYAKGWAYLLLNNVEEAAHIAEEIEKLVDAGMKKKYIRYVHHLRGRIARAKGEIPQAIRWLSTAVDSLYSPEDNFPDIHAMFIPPLAELYYQSGDLNKAAQEYSKVTSLGLGRLFYGDIYARSLYMLGRILEETGQKTEAVDHYERFLHLWQNADLGTPEVSEARKRLAALENR